MLTVEEIRTFIDSDTNSDRKRMAQVGQDYYEGRHKILQYRIFFVDADGNLREDKYKSNYRISHPFFAEIADQEVQYILSGPDGFLKSDIPGLQEELDSRFNDNEDFFAELYEVLTDCIVRGFGYAYAYKGDDGKTVFQHADSMGVVEVRAKETNDQCDYVIYWYIDRIGKDNKEIKRIEVWDSSQTYYYVQVDGGEITVDEDAKYNPRPHTLYRHGKKLIQDDYGVIPFFSIHNNRNQQSGLYPIKAIIDSYDLMNCGLVNNIQDTNEATIAVTGFEGDDLDELMLNLRAKKHIGVGEGGKIEALTIEIPVEARKTKMEIDEANIYRFGMALNTNGLKDTAATTNIAIKSAYSLLDLKVNKLEIHLKQFMRKLLTIVLDEINAEKGAAYTQGDVYFKFEREVPTNAEENAKIELTEAQTQSQLVNTLLNVAERFGDELTMQYLCDALDVDYQEIKGKLPKPEDDPMVQAEGALNTAKTEEGAVM